MTARVVIVGRPNVGKSTLFNRLVGKRMALVDDRPGVTRDRRESRVQWADLDFFIVDTGGLEEADPQSLAGRMRAQTETAVKTAAVVLFVIDARAGLTPLDSHFAAALRRFATPVVAVANKCEGKGGSGGLMDSFGLGFGDPVAVSAEHGEGIGELLDRIRPYVADEVATLEGEEGENAADEGEEANKPLRFAIVGRPNVGKSTLVNRLLGEDRVLTGPEPGITRDAIAIDWSWQGRPVRLVDTAGLRRRARIEAKLEKLSAADSLRTIRMAEVVALVIEATAGLDKQDLAIADLAAEEGRALIVIANKWDMVTDDRAVRRLVDDRLERSLTQVQGVPVVTLSSATGQGMDKLMPAVFRQHAAWRKRVPTGQLNRWLREATASHAPPAPGGRPIAIRYITQVKAGPPSFAVFVARPKDLPDSYLRYLANGLRQSFGFDGVPLRLYPRKGDNPYVKE